MKYASQPGPEARILLVLWGVFAFCATAASADKGAGGEATSAPAALRVDKAARMITFTATATGLAAGEAAEFILVRKDSAKDYEAMALTTVPPSVIDAALRGLGMVPGRAGGMSDDGIPLWPKGERVLVSYIKGTPEELPKEGWTPVEHLVVDEETGKPLVARGFVFTGSKQLPDPEQPDGEGETVYAADVYGPQSVIALYNEPRAVMEPPLQALQGDVYARFLPNPDLDLAEGDLLTVCMKPEYPGDRDRVLDLSLTMAPAEGKERDFRQQQYWLRKRPAGGGVEDGVVAGPRLAAVLNYFGVAREDGRDPFVTIRFDEALPVSTVVDFCRLVDTLDVPPGIRVEPPPQGQIYYRAFAPNPAWGDRDQRVTQPYELELEIKDGEPRGLLRYLKPVWEAGSTKHTLEISETPVKTARELAEAVRRRKPGMEALFVETPGNMTYGALLDFTRQARQVYPTVFVFTRP